MKTFIVFLLAAVLGIVLGVAIASFRIAQAPWDGNPTVVDGELQDTAHPQSKAKLVVEQSKFDFGSMDMDENKSHDFVVKNAGNAPLILNERETSCGCVVGELEQSTIPPNGTAKINVKWKSKERIGQFSETATFTTNDAVQQKFTLSITGQITANVRVIPKELIFNQISANEPTIRQARLLCYLDKPFELLGSQFEATENASSFQVDAEPLSAEQLKETQDARSGYLLKVTVKPGLPSGTFKQKIRLQTNFENRPEIDVPIQGTVAGDIRIAGPGWNDEEGVLYLGIVNSRQGRRQRMLLIVRGPYRKEVKFKIVENPALPIQLSLGETNEINNGLVTQTPLILEIPKGSRSVNFLGNNRSDWGEITIETTHPEIPKIRLLVQFAVQG